MIQTKKEFLLTDKQLIFSSLVALADNFTSTTIMASKTGIPETGFPGNPEFSWHRKPGSIMSLKPVFGAEVFFS